MKAKSDKKQLESSKALIEKRRDELFKLKEPIDAELHTSYQALEKLNEQLSKLLVEEMGDQVDWKGFVNMPDSVGGMALYYYYQKALEPYHASSNGRWADTSQRGVQFCFYKKEEADKQLELIRLLATYYKPSTDESGGAKDFVRYSLLTKDLSEGGCVELHVTPDASQARVNIRSWGRDRELLALTSLEEAIAYLRKNHYYQKSYES